MYPAGTRYRPWLPETKKGIKEAASYINSFDYFVCSSISGNNMIPEEHEDMTGEKFRKDIIVFNFGEIHDAKKYIEEMENKEPIYVKEDKEKMKQIVVDGIMEKIDILHNNADEYIKNLNNSLK